MEKFIIFYINKSIPRFNMQQETIEASSAEEAAEIFSADNSNTQIHAVIPAIVEPEPAMASEAEA